MWRDVIGLALAAMLLSVSKTLADTLGQDPALGQLQPASPAASLSR